MRLLVLATEDGSGDGVIISDTWRYAGRIDDSLWLNSA
jgi:hypothetical protein